VCIAVTDHGIGISPGDRRRLFRQFHRGAAALNANVSGVGLGLAMCRHIVRRHGGRIDVRSEEGKGSTFTVWLPAWTESER
jgi:signal transduction histidine kinase